MFDGDKPVLLVPLPDGEPERLDIAVLYDAQRRIPEIANANEHTAPNLLSVFNLAYLEASALHKRLAVYLGAAAATARRRRAAVLLEVAPAKLKELGLVGARNPAGSEDLRGAVLDADEEYGCAADRVSQIEAMVALVAEKKRGFEMAYGSVKAIVAVDRRPFAQNPHLSTAQVGDSARGGFGGAGF